MGTRNGATDDGGNIARIGICRPAQKMLTTPYFGPGGSGLRHGADLPDGLELDSADVALELPPERARLRLRQIVRQCSRKGWKNSAAAKELLGVSLEYLRDVE